MITKKDLRSIVISHKQKREAPSSMENDNTKKMQNDN